MGEPKVEKLPPQPPAVILADFCKRAEIEITVFQAESLWAQVRGQLIDHDEQDVWDYFRWKLSDLSGTEFPTRAKLRFLSQDVSTWIDQQRKRNVGRNNFQATEPIDIPPAHTEPEPQMTTSPAVSSGSSWCGWLVWEAAISTLKKSVSRKNFSDWIEPLTPIGVDGQTLHLDAHDEFKAAFVDDNYRTLILDTLAATGASVASVKFHPEFII